MQAKITRDGECYVVHLIGRLDIETAQPFRKTCLEQLVGRKVVFDFNQLSFVGSTGILPFLEIMQDFARTNRNALNFCNVGSEFRRILSATSLSEIEVFDTQALAAVALSRAPQTQLPSANGVVAVPTNDAVAALTNAKTTMLPERTPRAITEGINPIFIQDDVADDAADDLDENGESGSSFGEGSRQS
jgi:anti-anti-sigma factor